VGANDKEIYSRLIVEHLYITITWAHGNTGLIESKLRGDGLESNGGVKSITIKTPFRSRAAIPEPGNQEILTLKKYDYHELTFSSSM